MESANLKISLLNKQEEARTSPSSSPFSSCLLLSTSVTVAGSLCYGFAMSYSSPAQSKIMEEVGLNVAQYSFFTSVMILGGLITATISGKIAALVGRRQTMWIADVCCIFGWLAIALANDIMLLYTGRLFLGFGVGLTSYVASVYIAEITPKKFRGGFSFSNQLLQSSGVALVFFTGNYIHWRTLAILSDVWSRYGQDRELGNTLKRLRGQNNDIFEEAAEIRETLEISKKESESGIKDLFHMKNAHSLTIGMGLMVSQQFCGSSAIMSYAARIFDKAGFSSKIGTTILASVLVPQSIVVMFAVDRCGRRPLLMISSFGLCICSFLIGLSYYLKHTEHEFQTFCSVLLIVGLVGYKSFFVIGLGGLPWIIMSEVFPVNVKVAAGSLVTVSNWLFTWIIVYSFNFMIQWSSSGTYFIFSGISLATVVFVWTLVPETKGRTLEDIQASLVQLPSL